MFCRALELHTAKTESRTNQPESDQQMTMQNSADSERIPPEPPHAHETRTHIDHIACLHVAQSHSLNDSNSDDDQTAQTLNQLAGFACLSLTDKDISDANSENDLAHVAAAPTGSATCCGSATKPMACQPQAYSNEECDNGCSAFDTIPRRAPRQDRQATSLLLKPTPRRLAVGQRIWGIMNHMHNRHSSHSQPAYSNQHSHRHVDWLRAVPSSTIAPIALRPNHTMLRLARSAGAHARQIAHTPSRCHTNPQCISHAPCTSSTHTAFERTTPKQRWTRAPCDDTHTDHTQITSTRASATAHNRSCSRPQLPANPHLDRRPCTMSTVLHHCTNCRTRRRQRPRGGTYTYTSRRTALVRLRICSDGTGTPSTPTCASSFQPP